MRLLIHEKSYARNRAALDALERLEPVVMGDDGRLIVAGAEVTADEAQPEAAFVNSDAFFSAAAPAFLGAALKSQALKWVQ
ncbi:MAG TPA: hypothetical protein VFH92_01545, partial [Phenylobacterium sp.]|nr:hypothetical protein [Phenylobacterium sp.]